MSAAWVLQPQADFRSRVRASRDLTAATWTTTKSARARRLFPVSHPGALLFIGDGHALQGDGEPTGNGIETSMDVEFTVDGSHKMPDSSVQPEARDADYIISIGSQPEFASPLDRALQIATSDMVDWLTKEYKMEPWAAHLLIGSGQVRRHHGGRFQSGCVFRESRCLTLA